MVVRVAKSKAQHVSASKAATLVPSNSWIDYASAVNQPDVFDLALAERRDQLENVKIRHCLTMRPRAVIETDPDGKHFYGFSWHFTGYDRKQHDLGRCGYIPLNLGEVPDYYRRFLAPSDLVIIKTCPMDKDGYFNLSTCNLWHRAMIERAKVVVVEVNEHLPFVLGPENGVHISEVDFIIDGDDQKPPELPNPPPSQVDRSVAGHIMTQIQDGDCLQIGIGGMPNAVCILLLESGIRGLGIHTEMLTDGIVDLYHAGMITGDKKTLDRGKIGYTFGIGSNKMYDTVNRNPDFVVHPVDYTNLPHHIMQNDNVVSINNTTQIDLQGQAASESDGHRHISGTGGQLQFVRGAYASKNGKSFICLASTYEKNGVRKSRIVLNHTTGNIITTPRSDVMFVVTEFGLVNLKGKSVAERALALISIAHPDFREGLERQARELGIIPNGVRF
jgi:acyl-CoA hydrolase